MYLFKFTSGAKIEIEKIVLGAIARARDMMLRFISDEVDENKPAKSCMIHYSVLV